MTEPKTKTRQKSIKTQKISNRKIIHNEILKFEKAIDHNAETLELPIKEGVLWIDLALPLLKNWITKNDDYKQSVEEAIVSIE